MNAAGKVLIIDDDIGPRESLRMIIKDRYAVQTAPSALEGLKFLSEDEYSVILLDLRMPHMDGITALREIKKRHPHVEVLIVTAYASVETAREAIQHGAFDYLIKPFDKDDVITVVEKGMNKRKSAQKIENEHTELRERYDERTKELMITEKLRRELFDNASDGIAILNFEGVFLDLNPRACEIWGYRKEELLMENISCLEADENKEQWIRRLSQLLDGESLLFETVHWTKTRNKVFLEVSAKAIEIDGSKIIQAFYRDITEKKRFQEQLSRSQRMESIGTLAGGLAHDFNNILTAILVHTQMMLSSEREHLSKEVLRKLEVIESAAQHAAGVVSQLLSFSRRGGSEFALLVINDVIEGTLSMVSKLTGPKITIEKQLGVSVHPIMGNATQLGQVVMNLILNARDAMPDGGAIVIRTEMVDGIPNNPGTPNNMSFQCESRGGQFVAVSILDTGTGISEEHLTQIFEPFFTTKQKGTGLGLAAVYGIVKDHGGDIKVSSTMGCGSIFTLYFPVQKPA